ncbi:MAG: PQQ-binding-like beta-propeller repeat protein [Verrucomicrobiota bacterium]
MKSALVCLLTFALADLTWAQWPEFRGPSRDGTVNSTALPIEWSEEKNIVWKTPLHGLGHSTPVIEDGKIWLTTATEDGRRMSVLCLDDDTGEVLLDRVYITNDNPEPLSNPVNTYASCSAAVEDGRVYIHFGSYGTFCLDTDTFEKLWQRRDIRCSHWRGPASSVALWSNKIILTLEGADQQYFLALDKETGDTLWRRDRSTNYNDETDGIPANSGDMRKGFSTPIFVPVGNTIQMISNGGKASWAYDVETGDEIWSITYDTHSPSSRPIYNSETSLVYLNSGLGKPEIWAVKLDPEAQGDVSESHVAWKIFQRTPKYSSPVIANGLLFMANQGIVSALDAASGEVAWADRAGGEYSASLLATPELVYFFDQDGLCTVIKASREMEIISENHLAEGMMASPAVSGDALIIRTRSHLYKISDQ